MTAFEFSPSTVQLFAGLLGQVNIPAGAPDFEAQAAVVTIARRELAAAQAVLDQAAPAAGDDELPGLTLGDDTPNRATRRAAAKSNGSAKANGTAKKAAKAGAARGR